jgi:hypothetical protein
VEVGEVAEGPNEPDTDVMEASKLPEIVATAYHAMYTYGMHLRIKTTEEEKLCCHSAIAASVWRRNRAIEGFHSGSLESMEYVGWIEEILELNYRSHCCIVLLCSWIPTELHQANSKVVRDRYGFAVGNFQLTIPLGPHSFAFPTQCRQVFFSDDPTFNRNTGREWKVICNTDVRGHQGGASTMRVDIGFQNPGRDSDFEGLQVVPLCTPYYRWCFYSYAAMQSSVDIQTGYTSWDIRGALTF